ncbi:inverse autotransporter beta domain-containing protein [Thermodesulfobacteriota bacterium]
MLGGFSSRRLISLHLLAALVITAIIFLFMGGTASASDLYDYLPLDGCCFKVPPSLRPGLWEKPISGSIGAKPMAPYLALTSDTGPGQGGELQVDPWDGMVAAGLTCLPDRKRRPAGKKYLGPMQVPHRSVLTGEQSFTIGTLGNYNRSSLDFFLPLDLEPLGTLFSEVRWEIEDPFHRSASPTSRRADLSLGAGLRRMLAKGWILGINWFYDSTNMGETWHSSTGFGLESVIDLEPVIGLAENHSFDTTINIYQGGGINAELGYTRAVLLDHLDLRISASKYRFFDREFILGWKSGVELISPDQTFVIKYEYGQDSRDPSHHSISCSVSLAFQLENLFSGKNPFLKPDPFHPGIRDH